MHVKCLGVATTVSTEYFFRSGPNLELEALAWEIPANFIDPDGRPLSDHEPIHVKFMLRAR